MLASYVHLHFGSAPELATSLVARCRAVDLQAVNAAASRACHEAELAAAHAEQQALSHSSHLPSHMASHMNGMHSGASYPHANLPKMMSTPDFAMPFQSSLRRSAAYGGRHSADASEIPCAHTQLQQQQQQQFLQQAHQHQQPGKVRYDADGRGVALDVYAQAYNPAEYQSLSPQRTSSLPIFYKPLKPHSLPTSPLHDVAEHSSVDGPQVGYQSHWVSHPGLQQQQQSHLVYPQQQQQQQHHQHLQQQQVPLQQQHSPFHSPLQGSSLHGSHSPTYPLVPLESTQSGAVPMNTPLHPNGTLLQHDPAMLTSHSGLLSVHSGMLSVNSGMLPEGAVYRPNSIGSTHPGMLSAQSSMLPNSMKSDWASSVVHGDGVLHRMDDTSTASTSGRLAHGGHVRTGSRSSSTGLQPASPDTAVTSHSIVSLLPSGTEILYALGLADR